MVNLAFLLIALAVGALWYVVHDYIETMHELERQERRRALLKKVGLIHNNQD